MNDWTATIQYFIQYGISHTNALGKSSLRDAQMFGIHFLHFFFSNDNFCQHKIVSLQP